jgi:hypothetical protein
MAKRTAAALDTHTYEMFKHTHPNPNTKGFLLIYCSAGHVKRQAISLGLAVFLFLVSAARARVSRPAALARQIAKRSTHKIHYITLAHNSTVVGKKICSALRGSLK